MQSKAVQGWRDTRTHRDANNFRAVLTDVDAVVLVQAILSFSYSCIIRGQLGIFGGVPITAGGVESGISIDAGET